MDHGPGVAGAEQGLHLDLLVTVRRRLLAAKGTLTAAETGVSESVRESDHGVCEEFFSCRV